MGAFFTNVQVHTGGRDAEAVRADLAAVVRRAVLAEGFAEVTDGSDESDRLVLVGPVGAGPWVAVFDEDTEDQDERALARLARTLSAAVGGFAVGVLVHDSDVLRLELHSAG